MRNHQQRNSLNSRKRQARKRGLINRDGPLCKGCGKIFNFFALTLDHIVPVARGGTNEMENLQLMCEPCNAHKADR